MGIEMNVELENVLTLDELIHVFNLIGVENLKRENYGISGNFPDSGMSFFVFHQEKFEVQECLLAEDFEGDKEWLVGARVSLRYINSKFDECNADIKKFIGNLEKSTLAKFVLSFQYEGVYATRDTSGLKIIRPI